MAPGAGPDAAAFWDRMAPRYARMAVADPTAWEATLARVAARLGPDDRVLEIGCGTGAAAVRLAPRVARYTATDLSPGMIALARARPEAAVLPHLAFVVAEAADTGGGDVTGGNTGAPHTARAQTASEHPEAANTRAGKPETAHTGTAHSRTAHSGTAQPGTADPGALPEDAPLDAILAFNLLHLLPDLPAALAALHARLRPGGLLLTKTPCLAELSPLLRLAVPALRLLGLAPRLTMLRRDGLEAAIAAAGFEILETADLPARRAQRYVVARRP